MVLVGPMGAGKSTVGKRLARHVGLPFADSDELIRERTGVDIPRIFDVEGEAGFRAREHTVLRELLTGPPLVLATGGGAVIQPENRALMRDHGIVIYLRTSVAEQYRRTARDQSRPLLQTEDPRARLAALQEEREPLYVEVATLTFDTDGGSGPALAEAIAASLEENGIGR